MPVTSSISSRVECSFIEIIMVSVPFRVFGRPKIKKPTLCEWAKILYCSRLDDGHPHPVAPVRKSPRVAIERERHVAESTDFQEKRKPDLAYRRHQRGYQESRRFINAGSLQYNRIAIRNRVNPPADPPAPHAPTAAA